MSSRSPPRRRSGVAPRDWCGGASLFVFCAAAAALALCTSPLVVAASTDSQPPGRARRAAASSFVSAGVSRPGGAGHALLFRDHVLLKKDFKDFPSTAMTFEVWLSSSDFCHSGTILSYAKDSQSTDESQRVADFNHFVIFDPRNVLACHDFEYIDLWPDPQNTSCHAAYKRGTDGGSPRTASAVERDGAWHHLAVTWDAKADGLTQVFLDGLLMASAVTHKKEPLVPGGAFMLGGEQDCFGGCTDPNQGFHGVLDEVRLWKVVRPQSDILRTMRLVEGLEGHPDLVAWWRFNEPDEDQGMFRYHRLALDSSGKGNHLPLDTPPTAKPALITLPQPPPQTPPVLSTWSLELRNNFAMSRAVKGMPTASFTVEMWAKGAPVLDEQDSTQPKASTLFSFATQQTDESGAVTGFMDDALRVERVQADLAPFWLEPVFASSTAGAVVLHINSNEHTDDEDTRAWIYFDAGWLDGGWHHLAVSWDAGSGAASLLFDGAPVTPIWKTDWGAREAAAAGLGGVDPTLSPGSKRGAEGALVLGQDQDCFGGCFSPSDAFFGELAVVRVWGRVLTPDEVRRQMGKARPDAGLDDLAALYVFDQAGVKPAEGGGQLVLDRSGSGNHLALRSNPPLYVYSTAPLAFSDGRPVAPPLPGAGGYSLALNDKQVALLTDFHDFPSSELTLEFWMWSVDTCRPGVPFSYASGQYEHQDNAFLLFNYNSFGVSVMEDEGSLGDHLSGVSATDGNWHHVAVTWRSSTGKTVLYDNGRPVWTVTRGKGKKIPSGGTLVIGREQDCPGGCFDSAAGSAGRVSNVHAQEYGPQDFFGVVEEMRLWRRVRTPEQIRDSMAKDDGRGPGGFLSPGVDPGHPDLVAYWKFDEGKGYVVHDVTSHGHDLTLTQPPSWQVTRWLSTCGNAVVEGLEECDDGDLTDGDGCTASCTVEQGWACAGSPSVCRTQEPGAPGSLPPAPSPTPSGSLPVPSPSGGGGGGAPAGPQPARDGGGGSPGGGGPGASPAARRRRSKLALAAAVVGGVLTALALLGAGVAAVIHRSKVSAALHDNPLWERLLSAVPGTPHYHTRRQRQQHHYAHALTYDPLDFGPPGPPGVAAAAVPDFGVMSPAPGPRSARVPPGSPGPYQSLSSPPSAVGMGAGPRAAAAAPAPRGTP